MKSSCFTFVFILFSFPTFSQHISKLEIKAKETFVVGPDNTLVVDTLIMHRKATIQFAAGKLGKLEAKVAAIGVNCTITAKGANGHIGKREQPGEDGENGGSLDLTINFIKLGKLTIDTSGGNGGDGQDGNNGRRGKPDREETQTMPSKDGKPVQVTVVIPGEYGTDGTDATMGGNGGNGGDIKLSYQTNGFIPIFNQIKRPANSITLLNTQGKPGRSGNPGRGGRGSADGSVKLAERRIAQDGKVELVNLNQQTLE